MNDNKSCLFLRFCVLVILLSLLSSGCGKIQAEPKDEIKVSSPLPVTPSATPKDSAPTFTAVPIPTKSEPDQTPIGVFQITVDPSLLDVEITFPTSLFADTDMSTFDIDDYIKKNNFKNAVINEDGSMTITVSKARHKEMLEEQTAGINLIINEMIESEETPYISGITHNSDFTKIVVDVDRAGYESTFDMTPLNLYFSAVFYQMIAGIENHSEIIIRDAETKEQIKIFNYPEAFGN